MDVQTNLIKFLKNTNMKYFQNLFLLILAFVCFISCSKSDDPATKNHIVGVWKGTLIQPEFGELISTIKINNTALNGQTGSGTFKSGDITVCDANQFNCIPLACSFNLSLRSATENDLYKIDQILIETNSTCGDGLFEFTKVDNNTYLVVWYEEAYPENRATGMLKRQ
jgi:hypothetical protein